MQLPRDVTVADGVLRFGGDSAHIGREADFERFLELSEPSRLLHAAQAMHDFLRGLGPSRTLASAISGSTVKFEKVEQPM